MARMIKAAFPSEESCSIAAAELQLEGYSTIISSSEDEGGPAIMVAAPFGRAQRIINILEASGALSVREELDGQQRPTITSRSAEQVDTRSPRRASFPDESFYVSSLLGLPLIFDNPAPLSRLLGIPTLIRE